MEMWANGRFIHEATEGLTEEESKLLSSNPSWKLVGDFKKYLVPMCSFDGGKRTRHGLTLSPRKPKYPPPSEYPKIAERVIVGEFNPPVNEQVSIWGCGIIMRKDTKTKQVMVKITQSFIPGLPPGESQFFSLENVARPTHQAKTDFGELFQSTEMTIDVSSCRRLENVIIQKRVSVLGLEDFRDFEAFKVLLDRIPISVIQTANCPGVCRLAIEYAEEHEPAIPTIVTPIDWDGLRGVARITAFEKTFEDANLILLFTSGRSKLMSIIEKMAKGTGKEMIVTVDKTIPENA